jgi:hypothetical protein
MGVQVRPGAPAAWESCVFKWKDGISSSSTEVDVAQSRWTECAY